MRSRFLLAALAALLEFALVLWMRASPGAAVNERYDAAFAGTWQCLA